LHGWCAAIRGVEGGGLVEGLPVHTFKTSDGEVVFKCPTEIAITDRREKELSDLGFIPLVHCKNTDYAAFFGAQSAQKPRNMITIQQMPTQHFRVKFNTSWLYRVLHII
jgi:type VI secretion system protein ImpC